MINCFHLSFFYVVSVYTSYLQYKSGFIARYRMDDKKRTLGYLRNPGSRLTAFIAENKVWRYDEIYVIAGCCELYTREVGDPSRCSNLFCQFDGVIEASAVGHVWFVPIVDT